MLNVALCVAGRRACPPEDSGGLFGYYRLLAVVKDPSHPEYEEMRDWVDDDFDPAQFDADKVNGRLRAAFRDVQSVKEPEPLPRTF